jgi:soluble lytic murein transglycosylase-like protein
MSLATVVQAWGDLCANIGQSVGVDPFALLAIIQQESQGNANATNKTGGDAARGGSYGLMQVSYATAQGYGYQGAPAGLLDPTVNVQIGARYFLDCLNQVGGGYAEAFSCYNSGSAGGAPGYAAAVMANYQALTAGGSSGGSAGGGGSEGSGGGTYDASMGCSSVIVVAFISALAYLAPIVMRLLM